MGEGHTRERDWEGGQGDRIELFRHVPGFGVLYIYCTCSKNANANAANGKGGEKIEKTTPSHCFFLVK
jgi:hypothetical protein